MSALFQKKKKGNFYVPRREGATFPDVCLLIDLE